MESLSKTVVNNRPIQALSDELCATAGVGVHEHEILDRVAELVPNILTFVSGRILERRFGCAQVAANHSIPIAESRIDVRRHVDRMRIVRRDPFVLARDLK